MTAKEIVKDFVKALESGDLDKTAGYLSDDFAYVGPIPLALGRDQFLEVQRGLLAAFPDRSLNLAEVEEEAGVVRATVRFTGTHTGDLVLPVPDLPLVRATGKTVFLPLETHLYTVRGSKIASIHVLLVPGGGFQGIYSQLGARLPAPQSIKG